MSGQPPASRCSPVAELAVLLPQEPLWGQRRLWFRSTICRNFAFKAQRTQQNMAAIRAVNSRLRQNLARTNGMVLDTTTFGMIFSTPTIGLTVTLALSNQPYARMIS